MFFQYSIDTYNNPKTRTVIFFFTVIALVFFSFLVYSGMTSTPEVELIIEGIKFNNSLLQSGKGHFLLRKFDTPYGLQQMKRLSSQGSAQSEYHPDDADEEIFFAFDNPTERIRCDVKSIRHPPGGQAYFEELQQVFDGEKTTRLTYQIRNPEKPAAKIGDIRASKDIINPQHDPRYWGINIGKKSLGEFFEQYGAELVGMENINGDSCYLLKTTGSKVIYKIWIAPKKGYTPQQMEFLDFEHPLKPILKTILQWRVYPGDIWFLQHVTQTIGRIDEKTEKYELMITYTLRVYDFEPNIDVTDVLFTIHFPSGTEVYDLRSNKSYITAPPSR